MRAGLDELLGAELGWTLDEALEEPWLGPRERAALDGLLRLGISAGKRVAIFYIPGRIEVLGKHTDYAGGRSLLAAAERGFTIATAPRADQLVTVTDLSTGQCANSPLNAELPPDISGWRAYPTTVVRRLARNFPEARVGADIVFQSDLPRAAGLSSSSAFVVGIFLALAVVNRLGSEPAFRRSVGGLTELGDYLGAVENGRGYKGLAGDRGVGTQGGSQDQTAILCSRADHLVRFAFAPVSFEGAVRLPAGYTFVIASSGVHASKGGAAQRPYNYAVEVSAALLKLWNRTTQRSDLTLGAALSARPDAYDLLYDLIGSGEDTSRHKPAEMRARLEQFRAETFEYVPAAFRALEGADLEAFGEIVDHSQRLAETGLQNQVEETTFLQRSARNLGATAASAFGAGFGGSVWALVEEGQTRKFLEGWRSAYETAFPVSAGRAIFFETSPAPGTRRVL